MNEVSNSRSNKADRYMWGAFTRFLLDFRPY